MKYFLAQAVLAAGKEDIENWTNILFVVVMGIFWALGGILRAKAKANKAASSKGQAPNKGQEQQAQALRERRIRALWGAMGFEEPVSEASSPVQQQKMVRPQPTTSSKPPPKKEAIGIEAPVSPKIKTPVEEMPQTEYSAAWPLGEILRDYEDTDRLRRAILHYEILGKPVSLRGSSEHIIGL